jgi:hypothetical protein
MPVHTGRAANIKDTHARSKRLGRLRSPVTVAENVTQAVQQINSGARRFRLREPIDLTARKREALESFADVFSTTWDAYAVEEDTRLSRDARQLKRQLRRLVAAVEPA